MKNIIDKYLLDSSENIKILENFVIFSNNLFLDETYVDAQLCANISDTRVFDLKMAKKIEKKLHNFLIIVQNAISERCMHLDIFDIVFYVLDAKRQLSQNIEIHVLVYEVIEYYFNEIKFK